MGDSPYVATDCLTFEQQKEMLLLQVEHDQIKQKEMLEHDELKQETKIRKHLEQPCITKITFPQT